MFVKEHASSLVVIPWIFVYQSAVREMCDKYVCYRYGALYVQHICVCTWVHIVPSDTRSETSTIHTHAHWVYLQRYFYITIKVATPRDCIFQTEVGMRSLNRSSYPCLWPREQGQVMLHTHLHQQVTNWASGMNVLCRNTCLLAQQLCLLLVRGDSVTLIPSLMAVPVTLAPHS